MDSAKIKKIKNLDLYINMKFISNEKRREELLKLAIKVKSIIFLLCKYIILR